MAVYSVLHLHLHWVGPNDFPHDFAGKVTFSMKSYTEVILFCCFIVKWSVFTFYICCFITKTSLQIIFTCWKIFNFDEALGCTVDLSVILPNFGVIP